MRVAVIGTGVIGRLRAQSVHDHPDTELAGVADVNRVSAVETSQRYGGNAYGDYQQMIDELRPDAVIVSSPVTAHRDMCLFALARGCHVFVEKPLANSPEACREIMRAADASGKAFAVGFNHRFYPSIKFLKQVVDGSGIGDIDHLRVFGGHDGLHNFRADWMYKSEMSGGGCMLDVGIHMTDLARYIAGEITEVYGVATNKIFSVPGSEDNAVAVMKTERGVPIIYQATWTEWRGYQWFVDVYGARGMVRASYAPMFNLQVIRAKPGAKGRKIVKRYPEIILRERLKGWQTTSKLTFDDELRDFLRMTRGEKNVDVADAWSGVRANEIADAVYRSTAEGRAITLTSRDAGQGARQAEGVRPANRA